MSPLLSLCLPAIDATTRMTLSRVDCALAGTVFDAQRGAVQIALAEVLNNVVEHGYRNRSMGAVAVHMSIQNDALSINITDWGQPYRGHDLPDGTLPDPQQLSEGGYGWFLIRSLMTRVTYRRQAHANHLSLRIEL